jgi:crossover junction endodeoxyribonuclease RusA
MIMTIIVYGMPGPQGSKKFMGMRGGRGVLVESSAKVKPWRQAVVAACIDARRCGEMMIPIPSMDGPIRASMVFTLPKPLSAPKKRRTWPDKKPDLSKLVRSTEDALVDSGIIVDDARIVCYSRVEKVFPGEDPQALEAPGVRIELERIA